MMRVPIWRWVKGGLFGFLVLELAAVFFVINLWGGWFFLGWLLLTGLLGALVLRRQGLRLIRNWQDAFLGGGVPEQGVVSGALLLLGGLLLCLPGFLADFVGVALLLPPLRRRLAEAIKRRVDAQLSQLQVVRTGSMKGGGMEGSVIEVEGVVVEASEVEVLRLPERNK